MPTSPDLTLPALLQAIDRDRSPSELARDIVQGVFRHENARRCTVYVRTHSSQGDILTLIGAFNIDQRLGQAPTIIHLDVASPETRCVRSNAVQYFTAGEIPRLFPTSGSLVPSEGSLVCVPMTVHDVVVGTTQVVFASEFAEDRANTPLFAAFASAMSVYLRATDHAWPRIRGSSFHGITARQRTVLSLIAAGHTNEAIAAHLGFSVSLVKLELSRMLRALRVATREQAVARAHVLGLLPLLDHVDTTMCRRLECRDRQY